MSRTTKPANSIEEKMAKMVAEEFDARVKEICSPTYYKNQYLKYAFQHHATPQCITRTYLEMLKSGREFSKNANDMKHLSYALERLIMVNNSDFIEFLSDTREVLKKETRKEYPYLIVDAPGRIKSFKSSEVKIRSKLLKDEVLKDTLSNLSSYGLESEEEEAMAKEYLLKLPVDATINNQKVFIALIDQLQPYGQTINEKITTILRYHKLLHRNPNCRLAIQSI